MNLINKNVKIPKVSIFCMVYNHEPFIRECLEGFLMQKCNFDYEIVLGEDCSTDNSRKIILEYANKFPEKFKLLLHDNNIGGSQNQKLVFENCTGKYIAMCEGDDYWTDPLKLQKQVDFLEANPDYGMVHTKYKIFLELENKEVSISTPKDNYNSFFKSILLGNYAIGTLTVCFRKEIYLGYLEEIFPHSKEWLLGDLPLWLYISQNSKINYIDEVTSVYRVLEESASNTLIIEKRKSFDKSINEIRFFFLDKYTPKDLKSKRKLESIFLYRNIITNHLLKGSKISFLKLLFQFYKVNRDMKLFIGSFKQIYNRFF
jgi:glycosyltransferase involved in cell wall biosynthesis